LKGGGEEVRSILEGGWQVQAPQGPPVSYGVQMLSFVSFQFVGKRERGRIRELERKNTNMELIPR
jgi:hypothetical protein